MKKSKKGISLIVLIITIIVIIILATAILVSVLTNNPISEANKARYESDRDNMQAVFTNTVGKIMAENQGVVNVTAGQINTETTGVTEATGEVVYTVDNATVSSNSSGKIVFDKGTNDATTYYTGKKLPIYAAGETKWYVDSEGVLSLEVAGVKYGSGAVVDGADSEETLAPGLYDENGNMTKSWEQLVTEGYLIVNNGTLYSDLNGCGDCHGGNGSALNLEGKLIIDNSITEIGYGAFGCDICWVGCSKITDIVLPDNITRIGAWAFLGCKSLTSISIPENIKQIDSYTFSSCTNLMSITIPSSVTSMELYAFGGCTNLSSINYLGAKEQWNIINFNAVWGSCPEITVHCTDGDIIIPAS